MCVRGLNVFVPDEIEVNALPAKTIRVPVLAAIREGAGFVTSVSAQVLGRTAEIKTSSPLTALNLRPKEVRAELSGPDPEVIARILRHAGYIDVHIDVSGADIEDGTRTSVTVAVKAVVSGRQTRRVVRIPVHVNSLPKVPGWYGGDGHVHSRWSPDVVILSISDRAGYAKDNGFGFIIITDHEDGVRDKWGGADGYCGECLAAEQEHGIPVLPGVEIASKGGGHCLAYGMNDKAARVPANRTYNPQDLLHEVKSHNPRRSCGIAAHPYERREMWSDWSVQGLAGIEIINRSRESRPEAVSQWFSLLNRDLARTLATGEFVVGVANSDCHNLQEPGGRGFTWIRPAGLTGTEPLDRDAVWETIRRGRVVASGSKDLGFFTLNGVEIGGTLHSYLGSTLAFDIEHHPAAGRRCRKVTVFSGDGRNTLLFPGRPGVPVRYEVPCPRSSTFFLVKFDFSDATGTRRSEVWTNPVFVRVD